MSSLTAIFTKKGNYVFVKSQNKSSLLHPVCERGHFPILKLLIERGAQLNAQNQVLSINLFNMFDLIMDKYSNARFYNQDFFI